MRLYKRVVNLVVAPKSDGATGALSAIESSLGFELSNLDCVFSAKKSLKPEPNTCEIKVYNLAPETRRVLELSKKLVVRLEAGYPDAIAQIYLGEVRSAHSTREGADIVTELSAGDSEQELATTRLNLTLGPKIPAGQALTAIVEALGVGRGNVDQVAAKLSASGKALFGPGTALSGNAARMLTDICRSADLEWSVQDGVIQILDRAKALEDTAVELGPSTGLIGSPTIDAKGVVSVTALLQPDLRPGRKIVLESEALRGGYRVDDCEYVGDTRGQEWYARIHAKAY